MEGLGTSVLVGADNGSGPQGFRKLLLQGWLVEFQRSCDQLPKSCPESRYGSVLDSGVVEDPLFDRSSSPR